MNITMEYDMEMINHLIRHRRSVKPAHFNGEVVPDDIIAQMLENARWAPTHALTQPWRFTVIGGNGLQTFATLQQKLYTESTPSEMFNQNKFEKLATAVLQSSHIILVGMQRQITENLPEWEEIAAVAAAVQNMLLTAAAYHIGAYWSTGGMTKHPDIKKLMGLGEKDKCLGMLHVGMLSVEMPDQPRQPIADKIQWVVQ
ncbi:MAG: nitroreductase [Chitinophagales bacterium]